MNNLSFATLRLGKTSVDDIRTLDHKTGGVLISHETISVVCTQVPAEFEIGTFVFIWLGSDNSKGMATDWKQGFKAIGQVTDVTKGEKYNDESTTIVEIGYVFPNAVNRLDILREAPKAYYWCSSMPIIGLDDHSNQTIRLLTSGSERAEIGAFFNTLNAVEPNFKIDIQKAYPQFAPYFEYSVPETDENGIKQNQYIIAAKQIRDYVVSTGFSIEATEDELGKLYDSFTAKFSPEALTHIPDSELLTAMFYSSESTNDCLCYWLEFNVKSRKYFGSIAGGSSFKFGLYQRKEDGVWISGSPSKPEELSDVDALVAGRSIRDMLVKGAEVISSAGDLSSPEAYDELDEKLNDAIGKYAGFAWVHKYFQMVFPTRFATWHNSDWQRHVLLAYGIHPSAKYYGRSGQLAIIANYAAMSAAFFSAASYDRFGDIKQFCRLGTSDGTTNHFDEWHKDGITAIGWPDIGPIDTFAQGGDVNRKAIYDKLTETYYPSDNRTASRKAGELATYYRTNENTVFVAMDGESLLAMGDAVGTYFFVNGQDFPHRKPITWHSCFTVEDRLPNKSEGLRTSCVLISDDENLLYLYRKYYYELTDEEAMEVGEEEKVCVERSPRDNPLHPLNQIIYGAPGTGKTYSSIEYAMAIVENREVDLSQRTREQRLELMAKYSDAVTSGQVVFTTFHQSYGYEEFVQGIRPDAKAGAISFKKVDGVFKTIADTAMRTPDKNYVIIIDEINRGNISKIFGELITLIEDDKRYGELNQLSVTLPLGERFAVPNNLYVIGTMNSADKSISLIDTALRRRFVFVEMAPNESLIDDATLKAVLLALNSYIKKELRSTDLLIGHAYFIGKTATDLGAIMNNNIIPLLYEYFYDDEAKIRKALDCLDNTDYVIDSDYRGRIRIKKKG